MTQIPVYREVAKSGFVEMASALNIGGWLDDY